MTPKCCICGKFCRPADSSTPFGGHPTEFFCSSCVVEEKEYYTKHQFLPSNWIPAQWEYEVAKILGRIRVGPVGAAWSHWHGAEEPIREGYERKWPND